MSAMGRPSPPHLSSWRTFQRTSRTVTSQRVLTTQTAQTPTYTFYHAESENFIQRGEQQAAVQPQLLITPEFCGLFSFDTKATTYYCRTHPTRLGVHFTSDSRTSDPRRVADFLLRALFYPDNHDRGSTLAVRASLGRTIRRMS
jgi:hypothetical protein